MALVQRSLTERDTADVPRICSGPRFEAVMDAMRGAETALADGSATSAWTSEERTALASALRDLYDSLSNDPADRSVFARFESIGPSRPESDGPMIDALIELDLQIGSLEEAEATLFGMVDHLADLEEALRDEKRAARLTEATERLFGAADGIVSTLRAGGYVGGAELELWDEAVDDVEPELMERGLLNRMLPPHRWISAFSGLSVLVERIANADARRL